MNREIPPKTFQKRLCSSIQWVNNVQHGEIDVNGHFLQWENALQPPQPAHQAAATNIHQDHWWSRTSSIFVHAMDVAGFEVPVP